MSRSFRTLILSRSPERVLHSIVVSRVVLSIREVTSQGYRNGDVMEDLTIEDIETWFASNVHKPENQGQEGA
ncbi:hypothetical protein E1B28_010675 [Marasmius oreades]|uniref:Uncharacterized protein n=1 Tax=Marasmius oreades TaxID=181124 RepID=A0A9P7UTW7_9AGAR|nr:uncharacterized protein E1B28_010675 [Marasmius oreades]KAG7091654.1 hypothetical protein E1B28_010675 [Marasmius oreades]